MSFEFTSHDGHTYRLDTEGGQVHLKQLDAPAAPQPLEPSEEDAS